jgi:hypothetical protein
MSGFLATLAILFLATWALIMTTLGLLCTLKQQACDWYLIYVFQVKHNKMEIEVELPAPATLFAISFLLAAQLLKVSFYAIQISIQAGFDLSKDMASFLQVCSVVCMLIAFIFEAQSWFTLMLHLNRAVQQQGMQQMRVHNAKLKFKALIVLLLAIAFVILAL